MSENKTFNYSFSSAGKNKYYASEVDEYLLSIAESYDAMQKNYKALEKKLKTLGPAIDEYNSNKNIIFSAIVRTESYVESVKAEAAEHSAEMLRSAGEEAESLLLTKKAEADAYYFNTTHDADEKLAKLQREIEILEEQSLKLQEKYLSETKEKAAEIIDNAKTKAAEIVAAAYHDAKAARQQSDEIIAATTEELQRLKSEIARYKSEIFSVVATIKPTVDSISDGAQFEFKPTEVNVDTDKLAEELPEFELNIDYDVSSAPPGEDLFEDISSFTVPQQTEPEFVENCGGLPFDSVSYDEPEVKPVDKFTSGIFSDDDTDDMPNEFSYQPDYDAIFEDLED